MSCDSIVFQNHTSASEDVLELRPASYTTKLTQVVQSALVSEPCRRAPDELLFMGLKSLGMSSFGTNEFVVV